MKLGMQPRKSSNVQLDGRLGGAKWCPIKQGETQVDGARIQCIDAPGNVHIQAQRFIGIELVGTTNQNRCKVRRNTPVAPFVGVCQRGAAHRLAQPHRVELGGVGTQSGLDVAQGFTPGQLRIRHDAKVLGTGESRHTGIARIALDDACKTHPGNKLH